MIQAIDDDANWLLHMVENLLSVTRISDQTAGVKTTLEPLEEVVPAAVSRFHKRLPQAQVQVQIPDEFVMVPMDATLIEQVLINLLENAVYHSGSSQPIELQAEVTETGAVFHVRTSEPASIPSGLAGCLTGIPTPRRKQRFPQRHGHRPFYLQDHYHSAPRNHMGAEPFRRRRIYFHFTIRRTNL